MAGLLDRSRDWGELATIAAIYDDPYPTSHDLPSGPYTPNAVELTGQARMRWRRRQRRRRRRENRKRLRAEAAGYQRMGVAVRYFAQSCRVGRYHQLAGDQVELARISAGGGTLDCLLCGELVYVPPGDVDTLAPG